MRKKIPFSFFIPAFLLMIIFVIFPILNTIYMSFISSTGEFVGFDNYREVLGSNRSINAMFDLEGFPKGPPLGAFVHNVIWILIHLPLSLFSGLALALILRDVKGSSVIKSIIFLGMVTPLVVGGLIIRFTFQQNVGIVNGLFGLLGFENLTKTWTAYQDTSLFALIFGSVWLWTGFSMILYSAGLSTIPKDYFEAAKIDGAGPFKTFFRITIPLLRPVTVTVITMTLLYELKIFDIVYVATRGGPNGASTVLAYVMQQYFVSLKYNNATAVASLLTLLTLIVSIPLIRFAVKK